MIRLLALALLLAPVPALAGPPFITDDPEPTPYRQWEIYGYGEATLFRRDWEGEAGLDLNYGAFRDVQLTATLPYGAHQEGVNRLALGDVELGGKYRFVHQAGALPDISIFPKLSLPTGGRRGTRRVGLQLPVWAEKDWGRWSLFGGGGRAINPGAGRRDFWFAGATVTRALGERLTLGAELFRQGRDADDARATTTMGAGATLAVAKHWSLLGAADAGVGRDAGAAGHRLYLALLFHG